MPSPYGRTARSRSTLPELGSPAGLNCGGPMLRAVAIYLEAAVKVLRLLRLLCRAGDDQRPILQANRVDVDDLPPVALGGSDLDQRYRIAFGHPPADVDVGSWAASVIRSSTPRNDQGIAPSRALCTRSPTTSSDVDRGADLERYHGVKCRRDLPGRPS